MDDISRILRKQRTLEYSVNKSDNIFKKYFICVICEEILNNPKTCSKCNENFCEDCQVEFIKNNQNCFYGCEENTFIKPHKTFLNFIESLKFTCIYGCNLIIEYNECVSHLKTCRNKIIDCKNEGCTYRGTQNEMILHVCKENIKTLCILCNQHKSKESHDCSDYFLKLKYDLEHQLNNLLAKYDDKFRQLEELSLYIGNKIINNDKNS